MTCCGTAPPNRPEWSDPTISARYGSAHAPLGRRHAKVDLGKHDEAIEDFEEAVRLGTDLAGGPGGE